MGKKYRYLLAVLLLLTASAPFLASALSFPYWGKNPPLLPCNVKQPNGTVPPCVSICQLIELLQRAAWMGISFAVFAIAPPFIAWGGIMILIARGSPQNLERGKRILLAAVVGTAIALGSWVIVNTFFMLLGITLGGPGTTWSSISCSL